MPLERILRTLGEMTGLEPPKTKIPYAVAWIYAALGTGVASLTGRPPRASLEAVRMARKKMYVRCEKAESELGFRPGPIEPALERAIAWFRKNQYC